MHTQRLAKTLGGRTARRRTLELTRPWQVGSCHSAKKKRCKRSRAEKQMWTNSDRDRGRIRGSSVCTTALAVAYLAFSVLLERVI